MHLDAIPREVLLAIAAMAVLYAIVIAAGRWTKRMQLHARLARARDGEREAAAILESHGYTVEGVQVASTYELEVDGAPVQIALRADYVVRRGGERFIAEVKTGQLAPRIQTPATRRQLLEYSIAFDAAGVVLVDVPARSVHRVVFPSAASRPRSSLLAWGITLAAVVLAAVVVVR
ncbi:MAG TPA: hypothetical protein VM925_25185 [Labilithrix sp.]|nr:hypothetical protein [Labilithrix sp.]